MSSITLTNASIVYPVIGPSKDSLVGHVKRMATSGQITQSGNSVSIVALKNINLQVNEGDRIGVLGRNGAGKTTMLRMITGVYAPVGGKVRVEGRISSLIDIQLGMNAHLTGYQNIKLRSLYMGKSENLIEEMTPKIAEFTELEDYLELPLSTYSSGMRLRLAFGIATAYDTDIMIMDEWLSAGDAKFKSKAQERLISLVGSSKIFLMASHSASLQKKMCDKGIVLQNGEIAFRGNIDDAIAFAEN